LHVRRPEGYFTDKYPLLVIPGYIYSVRGKPLTIDTYMRIQPEYMSFKNLCTTSSSYEFQAHQQRSQRCCFSQNALL
jgi:hypothetical protein